MRKKYLATIKRAQERGLPFNLPFEYFRQLKMDDCAYCGTQVMLLKHYCEVMSLKTPWMTIDRKDNSLGYVVGNVVSACFICNRIKSNFFNYDEMCEIGKNFVLPKMKRFEKRALEEFDEWCKYYSFEEDDF